MRILYLIFKILVNFGTRLFFKRVDYSNAPKKFFNRTIYVSNHASAFLDPLILASRTRPVYFFMTRSDVFKPLFKPFMWAAHMLPIYRQKDGVNTVKKNEIVFDNCSKILKNGRNLLLYGEGFTDDVFVRRLKPVKKGAIRIGFHSLEAMNWEKNVFIAAIGVNYTEPNQLRSEALISFSNKICLNDYKEVYLENPIKIINELTKELEKIMQSQITHVQKIELAPFHEKLMIITQKGMNEGLFNKSSTLEERWNYSKSLAKWLNNQDFEKNEKLGQLKTDTESYFEHLNKIKIEDKFVFWKQQNESRISDLLKLILLFPFTVLGMFHLLIPYLLIKRFVEKSFRRKVFWSSVKLVIGIFIMGLYNLPYVFLFYKFIYPNWWISIGYLLLIGILGILSYNWVKTLKEYRVKGKINKTNLTKVIQERKDLLHRIETIIVID